MRTSRLKRKKKGGRFAKNNNGLFAVINKTQQI